MTKPAMQSVATRLYSKLGPFNDDAGKDGEATSWALAKFCSWVSDPLLQQIVDYAEEDDLGNPGWSSLVDLDRVPDEAIDYLGQFVGVLTDPALTTAARKNQIAEQQNSARGSFVRIKQYLAAAVTAEGAPTTGYLVRERYDPSQPLLDKAYHFQVIIATSNTAPANDTTLAGLLRLKPAGLVLHYSRAAGVDWQYIKTNYASWTAVRTGFTDWNDLTN